MAVLYAERKMWAHGQPLLTMVTEHSLLTVFPSAPRVE